MADRVTVLDGVCPSCRVVVSRVESPHESSIDQAKAAVRAAGLIPRHYTSEGAKLMPLKPHQPNCPVSA